MTLSLPDQMARLDPAVIRTVSSITITLDGPRVIARLSCAAFRASDPTPAAVMVEAASWERVADLTLDLPPELSVEDQIRALSHSGLVGHLDAVRRSTPDGPPAWTVKTHAGSDAERSAWLTGLG